jgi:hypothetical protein
MSKTKNGEKITRDSVEVDIEKEAFPDTVYIKEIDKKIQIDKSSLSSVRRYSVNNTELNSATTVTGLYGENKDVLENWKAENNGENGNPHYKDIMHLKTLRGTVAHAEVLNVFAERDLIGEEEKTAENNLRDFESYRETYINTEKYPWKPDTIEFLDAYDSPYDWAIETTEEIKEQMLGELIPDISEVVAVEEYIFSPTNNVAGQVDFVYINTDGELVICDLKTSKYIYDKHRLQTSCYALGYEQTRDTTVDKLQVVRACPEKDNCQVETSTEVDWYESEWNDWNSRDELLAVYKGLATELQTQTVANL